VAAYASARPHARLRTTIRGRRTPFEAALASARASGRPPVVAASVDADPPVAQPLVACLLLVVAIPRRSLVMGPLRGTLIW